MSPVYGVVLGLLLITALLTCVASIWGFSYLVRLYDKRKTIDDTSTKVSNIEDAMAAYMSMGGMPDLNFMPSQTQTIYYSLDGKHKAYSLDELIDQMKSAGDLVINQEDVDVLKKFFEKATVSIEGIINWEPDDDDDAEDRKEWE